MTGSGRPRGLSRRAAKDKMKLSERIGECIGIIVIVMLVFFFLENQTRQTGFFTSEFGSTESLLFYGSALFGTITGFARALIGRRNPVRPLEAFGALLWASASYWLLRVFPFDFAHLPDLLPDPLRLIFWWLTNDVAKLILIVGVAAGLLQTVYTTWLYFAVRSVIEKTRAMVNHTKMPRQS